MMACGAPAPAFQVNARLAVVPKQQHYPEHDEPSYRREEQRPIVVPKHAGRNDGCKAKRHHHDQDARRHIFQDITEETYNAGKKPAGPFTSI